MSAPSRLSRSVYRLGPLGLTVGMLLAGSVTGCAPVEQPESAAPTAISRDSMDEQYGVPVESGSDAKFSASREAQTADQDEAGDEQSGQVPEGRDANLENRQLQPKTQDGLVRPTEQKSDVPREKTVPVYWAADTPEGLRLFREFRTVADHGDPIATAVLAMFNERPLDPDYAHHLPGIDTVGVSLTLQNVITLDFPAKAFERRYSKELAGTLIQQIVFTATAAAAQASLGESNTPYTVRILVDGLANQQVFSALQLEDEYYRDSSTLAAVWIIDPQEGSKLGGTVTIKGLVTSEADEVSWTLYKRGSGADNWSTHASESAELSSGDSPYSQVYSIEQQLEPGEYRLQVTDPISSTTDSKQFSVG